MNSHIPDFDALARSAGVRRTDQTIKAALIEVWNARGLADMTMIGGSLSSQMGGLAAEPYVKTLQQEISRLDATSAPIEPAGG